MPRKSDATRWTCAASSPPEAARARAPAGPISDADLLEQIRAGSEAHFSALYERYFRRVYAFVHGRLRNHADSEEVVQETFTTVFRSIESYRGQASLLSWIFGIAKNLTNNMIRRNQKEKERLGQIEAERLSPQPALESASPEAQLRFSDYATVVRAELAQLAPWQTEIFEMRHFENLSISEISERTARSSDSIRSSLYRVKRLLMQSVERMESVERSPR